MNEIECALTPDGGLDLVGLSQKLNVKECQASRCNAILIVALAVLTIFIEGPGRPLFTTVV